MKRWKHMLVLLLILLVGSFVGSLFMPLGGWSDRRSQWGNPLVIFLLSAGLTIATHWLYRRSGWLHKAQAIALWFLFGAIAAVSGYQFWAALQFIASVRR